MEFQVHDRLTEQLRLMLRNSGARWVEEAVVESVQDPSRVRRAFRATWLAPGKVLRSEVLGGGAIVARRALRTLALGWPVV